MARNRLQKIQYNAKVRLQNAATEYREKNGYKINYKFKQSKEYKETVNYNNRLRRQYEARRANEAEAKANPDKVTHDEVSNDVFYRVLNYNEPPKSRYSFNSIRGAIQLAFIVGEHLKVRTMVAIQFLNENVRKLFDKSKVDRALKDLWLDCSNHVGDKSLSIFIKTDAVTVKSSNKANRLEAVIIRAYEVK